MHHGNEHGLLGRERVRAGRIRSRDFQFVNNALFATQLQILALILTRHFRELLSSVARQVVVGVGATLTRRGLCTLVGFWVLRDRLEEFLSKVEQGKHGQSIARFAKQEIQI